MNDLEPPRTAYSVEASLRQARLDSEISLDRTPLYHFRRRIWLRGYIAGLSLAIELLWSIR